jgi:hypothetical protein
LGKKNGPACLDPASLSFSLDVPICFSLCGIGFTLRKEAGDYPTVPEIGWRSISNTEFAQ